MPGCVNLQKRGSHPFLKVKFVNKGIDALNPSNILNQKSVHNPPYFLYKQSLSISYTVNVVIIAGGKFRKTFHVGVIFTILLISLRKSCFIFGQGNFLEKGNIAKTRKLPPRENFHVYSSYTRSVATKIFNYKTSLQQLDFQDLSQDPPPCNCSDSEFLYAPCGI